ncbi:uncharacterized protein LOC127749461 [Frankliniella occidentalis]|uniref:Uncharacterized protein LOC127749461 n=1 Tax=Frankliniella occidentalis TaxID=133901 RepID=A0A9C6U1H5_FRAOC|nr:uncharacterized protein LOC127749461 [Frankliniella occidentalis]
MWVGIAYLHVSYFADSHACMDSNKRERDRERQRRRRERLRKDPKLLETARAKEWERWKKRKQESPTASCLVSSKTGSSRTSGSMAEGTPTEAVPEGSFLARHFAVTPIVWSRG